MRDLFIWNSATKKWRVVRLNGSRFRLEALTVRAVKDLRRRVSSDCDGNEQVRLQLRNPQHALPTSPPPETPTKHRSRLFGWSSLGRSIMSLSRW